MNEVIQVTRAMEVNGRGYNLPTQPTVVACVDGFDWRYLEAAFASDDAPFLQALHKQGRCHAARSAMPSFTNPNNVSIVTGVPPGVHGIAGNYFYDQAAGAEVMMNEPRFLRAPSILAALAASGVRTAVVTAKDKLRRLLAHGLPDVPSGICFSIESPSAEAASFLPPDQPSIYSAAASEAVFFAGQRLLESWTPGFVYLSTTDYIQHKYAPGEEEANRFVGMVDRYLAFMDAIGARIVLTADHGMNAKAGSEGKPNILFLADALDQIVPKANARVVLPITDPYVRHHGALGGFATVYVPDDQNVDAVHRLLARLPGVETVLGRQDAMSILELPGDRIGDLCVLADAVSVLGTRATEHDLSGLDRPLRSHGSTHEQAVPFIANFDLPAAFTAKPLRNFDAFAAALSQQDQPWSSATRLGRAK